MRDKGDTDVTCKMVNNDREMTQIKPAEVNMQKEEAHPEE